MYRPTPLAAAFAAFVCLVPCSLLRAGEVPVDYSGKVMQAYCASDWPGYYEPKVYFSPVFEIKVPPNGGPMYPQELGKAFAGFLLEKYGYVSTPNEHPSMCALMDSVAMAQGSKDILLKQARYNNQRAGRPGDPVVETGWKPASASAAAKPGA